MSGVAGLVEGFRARSGDVGFLDRLEDLRGRLIASVVVLVLCTAASFYLVINFDVLGVVIAPITPYLDGTRLKYLSPMDPFFITLQLALALGFGLALPYLLFQIWRLVKPLLLPDERRLLAPSLIVGFVLFATGVVFCYLLVLPAMLSFTMAFQQEGLEEAVVLGEYLKLVLRLLVAFGLAFELPIVIFISTLLGIVTPEFLRSKRRHAFAIILIAGALVTPPDVGSLTMLMIPVWLLYELSIVISQAVLVRRAAALAAAEN